MVGDSIFFTKVKISILVSEYENKNTFLLLLTSETYIWFCDYIYFGGTTDKLTLSRHRSLHPVLNEIYYNAWFRDVKSHSYGYAVCVKCCSYGVKRSK